jgi:hypothetical protein
VLANDLKAS